MTAPIRQPAERSRDVLIKEFKKSPMSLIMKIMKSLIARRSHVQMQSPCLPPPNKVKLKPLRPQQRKIPSTRPPLGINRAPSQARSWGSPNKVFVGFAHYRAFCLLMFSPHTAGLSCGDLYPLEKRHLLL